MSQEITRAQLADMQADRARTGAAFRRVIETGQAMGGLPEWMLAELRPLTEEGPGNGA